MREQLRESGPGAFVGGDFTAENAEIAETKSNFFLGALGVLSEAGGYKIFNRQDAKSAKKFKIETRMSRMCVPFLR
jgi:hypothetical protein